MILLKKPDEIQSMRSAGRLVAKVLDAVQERVRPGVSTWALEEVAQHMVDQAGAEPAFKGYRVGRHVFPCCLCISVNEEVVHGIPSKDRILQEGDIVSVDFGAQVDGFFGDSAFTFPVGKVNAEVEQLLRSTHDGLMAGIAQMQKGKRLFDIGAAIQAHADRHRLGIVRDFVGHGIGRNLHEDPQVPNFGRAGRGTRLKPGMVFAIEPMFNLGTGAVKTLPDGWTVVSKDRSYSAHFEHTVALTEEGPLILTERAGSLSALL